MHDVTPSVVPMAVRIAISSCMPYLMISFLFISLILSSDFKFIENCELRIENFTGLIGF